MTATHRPRLDFCHLEHVLLSGEGDENPLFFCNELTITARHNTGALHQYLLLPFLPPASSRS